MVVRKPWFVFALLASVVLNLAPCVAFAQAVAEGASNINREGKDVADGGMYNAEDRGAEIENLVSSLLLVGEEDDEDDDDYMDENLDFGYSHDVLEELLGSAESIQDPICRGRWRQTQYEDFTNSIGKYPKMTIISAQGLRRSQLSKDQFQYGVNTVEEAECMTCDDMPYGNDSQLLAKLDCLLSQLRFLGRSKADVDSRKISHGAAGLNFLLYDIKARGAALFEAVYSEKTSSRDFLPFYSNELFADQHRLNSENFRSYEKDAAANMCGSLMQTHVDPRRIADEYRTCLAAAIPCIKKSSSNEVNETRSPAIKVATGLFTRYLQAGKEEAHRGKVNANTAGSLIQSWRDYAEANLSDISSEELQYTVKLMQDSLKRHFMR